jgi:hypothetical protein
MTTSLLICESAWCSHREPSRYAPRRIGREGGVMASLATLEQRIRALEARLAEVEGGYGDTLYRLRRDSIATRIDLGRLLDQAGVARATDRRSTRFWTSRANPSRHEWERWAVSPVGSDIDDVLRNVCVPVAGSPASPTTPGRTLDRSIGDSSAAHHGAR